MGCGITPFTLILNFGKPFLLGWWDKDNKNKALTPSIEFDSAVADWMCIFCLWRSTWSRTNFTMNWDNSWLILSAAVFSHISDLPTTKEKTERATHREEIRTALFTASLISWHMLLAATITWRGMCNKGSYCAQWHRRGGKKRGNWVKLAVCAAAQKAIQINF